MKLQPWMFCKCGNIHIATFIGPSSSCSCGERLQPQFKARSTNARGKEDV